jgi:hypothetical protein
LQKLNAKLDETLANLKLAEEKKIELENEWTNKYQKLQQLNHANQLESSEVKKQLEVLAKLQLFVFFIK